MSAAKSLLVAAIISFGFAGAAEARNEIFTAKLETPMAEPARVIAEHTLWSCDGDTCRARPSHASSVRACRQLVREVRARILAYGPEARPLSADEIARCNNDAAAVAQARN